MHYYQCRCGNVLFFNNSLCLKCKSEVGYDIASDTMPVLDADAPFKRCRNGVEHAACNWIVAKAGNDTLCQSCQLNRTIPDLKIPANRDAWRKIEAAKRRILYALARLGLSPVSKNVDARNGLAFDFLRSTWSRPVITGHEGGVITMSVSEAEDPERERQRGVLGEAYRTLIGHFRHEIAHYFWNRFFSGKPDSDPLLGGFREVFGDERQDYAAALARHYRSGSPPASPGEFITAYAAVHPWEDWAETWAHYFHTIDGLETAASFGLKSEMVPIPFTLFPAEAATLPAGLSLQENEHDRFLDKLHAWAKVAPAINEIVASLGHESIYPFVLSVPIVRKLYFVHYMIQTSGSVSSRAKPGAGQSETNERSELNL